MVYFDDKLKQARKIDVYGFPFFYHQQLADKLLLSVSNNDNNNDKNDTVEFNLHIPNVTTQEFYLQYKLATQILESLKPYLKCANNVYLLRSPPTHAVTIDNTDTFVFHLNYPEYDTLVGEPTWIETSPYPSIEKENEGKGGKGGREKLARFDIACIKGYKYPNDYQRYDESKDQYWERLHGIIKQKFPFVPHYQDCCGNPGLAYNSPVLTIPVPNDIEIFTYERLIREFPSVYFVIYSRDTIDKM